MATLSMELNKVSDFFVWKAFEEEKPITNKKVQKLVYYAQAWNLVFLGKTLYSDPIEAWIHGPAVRALYSKYKTYGYRPITIKPDKPDIDEVQKAFLEDLWSVYGPYDADYLEVLSHSEEPWLAARGNADSGEAMAAVINTESMRKYYVEKLGKTKTVSAKEA